jgi:hypothetical protein
MLVAGIQSSVWLLLLLLLLPHKCLQMEPNRSNIQQTHFVVSRQGCSGSGADAAGTVWQLSAELVNGLYSLHVTTLCVNLPTY